MKPYRNALVRFTNKEIDWNTDALVWTLHTSTYTPNFDTHSNVSDLTNELASGSGYTAGTASGGGLAIASPTMTYTAANSWTVQRANSTAYALGDVVRPATGNGYLYECVVAGTSGGTIPTYPTVIGTTVADGGATWVCAGAGITVLGCTDPQWASPFSAGPCRYAVLSDRSSGVNTTNPLIGLIDFGSDKTGGGGTFTINLHTALRALHFFVP